ncbi:MAG: hypothetical protein BRD43_05285 [Bacteroidetes bacterium QS_4_64_154]|nr:MAG: hypothetical protein BRD43_05285 [Bacteroidetes bacterium QS_4_64_154]
MFGVRVRGDVLWESGDAVAEEGLGGEEESLWQPLPMRPTNRPMSTMIAHRDVIAETCITIADVCPLRANRRIEDISGIEVHAVDVPGEVGR